MLGYLLGRSGIRVTVLEKHRDFFRDFRGDTVHPSTLEVLYELGLLDEFLRLPHDEVTSASAVFGDFQFEVADLRHVPARCKFIALMPQWGFLNFLSSHAKRQPSFDLRMEHEAVDLIREGDRIAGVVVRGPEQREIHVRADLVIGCDGRHSNTRRAAGLDLIEFGVPIDVLWFRISRRQGDPAHVLGNFNYGKALVLIDRSDYFQAGLLIPKGSFDEIRRRGLAAFRQSIRQIAPFLDGRVEELKDWEQVKILTVQLDRLRQWYRKGLLCVGDAAHAMSPAGGVGINLAIQDAVAAANLLTGPLLQGGLTEKSLAAVQRRREFPTRITQAVQAQVHQRFAAAFRNPGPAKAPWQLKLAVRIPGIHRALGYAVGIGARPEHVRPQRRPSIFAVGVGVAVGVAVGLRYIRLAGRSPHTRTRPIPGT